MNKLVGFLTALILGLVVLDVAKEGREVIGVGPVLILLAFGVVMWWLLGSVTKYEQSALPIKSALWLHSGLEGALAALSFSFGLRAGLIVVGALLIHLLPESIAMIAALKQSGLSSHYAIKTYLISVGILLTSFVVFTFLPANESALTVLSTIVAGGFIYLSAKVGYRTLARSQ